MRENSTKRKLREGGTVYGCFVRYPDAGIAEFLALEGFDFVVLDGEHGTIDVRECEQMARAVELWDVTPVVRVPVNQPSVLLRFLDTGAQGVHVPLVASADDARAAVRSIKYWPEGARGLAGVRAASYGQRETLGEYVSQANAETLTVIQIETREGLAAISEIASEPGVDVVFIGPTDVSQALGLPGQTDHPLVRKACEEAALSAGQSDAALGILVRDEKEAVKWHELGARYIAVTVEGLLARSARRFLEAMRG